MMNFELRGKAVNIVSHCLYEFTKRIVTTMYLQESIMKTQLFTLAIFCMLFASCHHANEPPAPKASVQLTAIDTGVVDAQIRLQVTGSNVGYAVAIKRDGQTIFASPQPSSGGLTDTTVLDTALLPKHTYAYKAYAFVDGRTIDSSALLPLTTMDTASHDISWEMYSFGEGSYSILFDVWICSETSVWAVGRINTSDSVGFYNVARWNGRKWNLDVIRFIFQGQQLAEPLRAIYAFGENDLWVGGAIPYHWDGNRWISYTVAGTFGGNINKIFGTSSSDLYIVGTNGSISHFDGSKWSWVPSGTTLDIQDIWGAENPRTGEWEILATAGNHYISNERKILSIKETTVTSVPDSGIHWALSSVWFMPGRQYWVAGSGMWEKDHSLNSSVWKGGPNQITNFTTNRIRGLNTNDLFICGDYGDLRHFNGMSWRNYGEIVGLQNGLYRSVAMTESSIFVVGDNYDRAIIARGTRVPHQERR